MDLFPVKINAIAKNTFVLMMLVPQTLLCLIILFNNIVYGSCFNNIIYGVSVTLH